MNFKRLIPFWIKNVYWYMLRLRGDWRRRQLLRIGRDLVARHGYEVAGGPFAGMRYVAEAFSPNIPARLIGTYEAELQTIIERVVARRPRLIVDIGCAEGYYVVGLARRLPNARIIAFDISLEAREQCRLMAEANGVADRVSIRGACDQSTLADLDFADSFLLCDCEGYEVDLIDPERIPGLNQCELLVELHDAYRPGARAT